MRSKLTFVKRVDFEGLWDRLQGEGRSSFTSAEIQEITGASPESVRAAVANAARKGLLFSPTRGLYVTIPPTFRRWGTVPAEHFIDPMMRHLGCGYYTAFLSAAAWWGSSHHAVQEYQVVVDRYVRDRAFERVRLRFHHARSVEDRQVVRVAGPQTMLMVSTPEQTTVDLVEHQRWGYGTSNISTVLAEMPPLDGTMLAELASRRPQPVAQRLGWLLDFLEADVDLAPLEQLARSGRTTPLSPRSRMTGERSQRWGVIVNTPVEPDV